MSLRKWSRVVLTVAVAAVLALPVSSTSDEVKKNIQVVLVPERNIFNQQSKYMTMCDYICSILPVKLEFHVLKDYEDVMEALENGEAEAGVLGSFLMVHGMTRHGFIPLVRPVWKSGESNYHSVIFTKVGSKVTKDIKTWEGRSFAFANRHTSAGFFFPLYIMRSEGIKKEPWDFFSEMMRTGSHDAALWTVSNGLADIGAAKNTVFQETMRKNPELNEIIEILYAGGKFPDATFAVTAGMDPAIREALKQTLLEMHNSPEGRKVLDKFGAKKFIPSPPEDYNGVLEVVEKAGFDIDKISIVDHLNRKLTQKDR